MIDESILKKLVAIEDLPTLRAVVCRILMTIQDGRSSAQDLTEALECDYSIAARVLRLANSPFYGVPCRVDSIRRAIVFIGFDAVKVLALASSVFEALSSGRKYALDPEDFWMHSLGAAKAAQIISTRHRQLEAPGAAFTASLLHDFGKIMLTLTLEDEYNRVVITARDGGRNLKDVEMAILGTDHAEVGAWIAEKWHFPQAIVEAIATLYGPHDLSKPNQPEAAVVALSDLLSRMADFGLAGDLPVPPNARALRWNELGLRDRDLEGIAQELYNARDNAREFVALLASGSAK